MRVAALSTLLTIVFVSPASTAEISLLTEQIELLKSEISSLHKGIAAQQTNSDHIWTMICAGLVMMMQIGFLFLEAGTVRSKNSINVAQKNIADFFISVCVFYLVGFSVMFAPSVSGWFGNPFSLGFFNQIEDWSFTFFVFQAVFVGTAATILSGAVAERMKLRGYFVITAVIAALIYPVFGYWAWGSALHSENTPWLASMGFLDFAGSTVVHSVGGWVALAGIIVLGPRFGRFNKDGSPKEIHGHSAVLATAGAVILLVGWMGFNGGSTVSGTPDFAKVIANTLLAAAFAGIFAMIVGRLFEKIYKPYRSINGVLAGLVGITAGCGFVDPHGAIMIGIVCGTTVFFAEEFILKVCKLDDVIGAVAVHAICGAIGTILVAFFALPEFLTEGSVWQQFKVQSIGVVAAFIWTFPISLIIFKLIAVTIGLRVNVEDELEGLNSSEHGASLGTGELQERLQRITQIERDLTVRLDETSGDETAEIAAIMNPFLEDVHEMISQLKNQSVKVASSASTLSELSEDSVISARDAAQGSQAMTNTTTDLSKNTQQLDSFAREITDETRDALTATQSMSQEINLVSDAINELAESVALVGSDADIANQFAHKTKEAANTAREAVDALAGASNDITNIVNMIGDVAAQTNLLALNATIEASRAGAAGQGFAVVANEVKMLSDQTTKATEDIRQRVSQIRANSTNATGYMAELHEIADRMGEAVSKIHSTTQEQTTIAGSISSNSKTAVGNAELVSEKITMMNDKISNASSDISSISQSAHAAGQHANSLSSALQQDSNRAKDINDNALTLADVSESLSKSAKKYKV